VSFEGESTKEPWNLRPFQPQIFSLKESKNFEGSALSNNFSPQKIWAPYMASLFKLNLKR